MLVKDSSLDNMLGEENMRKESLEAWAAVASKSLSYLNRYLPRQEGQ